MGSIEIRMDFLMAEAAAGACATRRPAGPAAAMDAAMSLRNVRRSFMMRSSNCPC